MNRIKNKAALQQSPAHKTAPPNHTLYHPNLSNHNGYDRSENIMKASPISVKSGTLAPNRPPLSTSRIHDRPNSSIEPPSSKICLWTQLKHWLVQCPFSDNWGDYDQRQIKMTDNKKVANPNNVATLRTAIQNRRGRHFQDRRSSGKALTTKKKVLFGYHRWETPPAPPPSLPKK